MKSIKYICYYNSHHRQFPREGVPSATTKIDYIIDVLNRLGYTVKITVNSCNNFETDNIDVYAVSGKVTGTGFKCGDLNGDDKIDSVDLILMRKYIAGYAVNIDIKAADLNCDGKINTVDLTLLRKYIAGYTVIFGK